MPGSPPPSFDEPADAGQSRMADAASGGAVRLAAEAGPANITSPAHAGPKSATWPARLAVACLVISTTLMIIISFLGPSAGEPPMPFASPGPLFFANAHPGTRFVSFALWIAAAMAAGGIGAGLIAIRRGWRPRPRLLISGSLLAVILLMLVPPIGSTDLVDDAIYGRIAALGHSPYLETPHQLRITGDPVASFAPRKWRRIASPYGPLTTITQAAASDLAGDSASRTMFWLKVWNALAFLAVALALDRFLRSDAARRARGHLLWTVNPLVLLEVMGGGHNDVLGLVFGLLGVLALRRLRLTDGLIAGLLIGLAITIKAPFAIFGLGLAIGALRSPRALAGLGLGAAVVVVPSYALAGMTAVKSVLAESGSGRTITLAQPLQLLADVSRHFRGSPTQALAILATVALAALLLWRLPAGPAMLPGLRPVLAVTLAWLVWSPVQRAWYDVLLFPLLALMPATGLDWIVLGRALVGTIAQLPGNIISNKATPLLLVHAEHTLDYFLAPLALLVLAGALAWLCVTNQIGGPAKLTMTKLAAPQPSPP